MAISPSDERKIWSAINEFKALNEKVDGEQADAIAELFSIVTQLEERVWALEKTEDPDLPNEENPEITDDTKPTPSRKRRKSRIPNEGKE